MRKLYLIMIILIFISCFNYGKDLDELPKNFFIVSEDNSDVYSAPDTNAGVMTQLRITAWVNGISNVNNKNQWVFIDTQVYDREQKDTYKGWILRSNLATTKDFIRVTRFDNYKIEGSIGMEDVAFEFYKDGTYKRKLVNENKYTKGKVYRYRNVITTGGLEYFYLNEFEDLCSILIASDGGARKEISAYNTNDREGRYFIITGDNVNVRAKASTNSAVLMRLSKGAKVKLVRQTDISLTIGKKKGFWMYIETDALDSDQFDTIKGWIFDYYLKKEE